MKQSISLVRRAVRVGVLPLLLAAGGTLAACESTDRITTTSEAPLTTGASGPVFSASFSGGIPFGAFALPTEAYGDVFNGALRNIHPKKLLKELADIRDRGGKVVLMFAGNERHYKGGEGHFSLTLWKERVDEFRGVNFSSFIDDGTIIAHYLIDEPNDPFNWNGEPIPGSTLESMAEYSKSLWPTMPTVVRAEPGYLARSGGPYRYLDAAWAQYVARKGTPEDYIRQNASDAQKLGLGLITGLNITLGGPGGVEMSAALVESAGSTILANAYPCAFISWQYRDKYMGRSDIQEAMGLLAGMAREHATKSCRGAGREDPPPPPPPPPPGNSPPSAGFVAGACLAEIPCQLTDRSTDADGSIAGWSWVLGNGTTSTEANPLVTYAAAGAYEVTLTVSDNTGATSSFTRIVQVSRGTLPGTTPITLTLSIFGKNNRQYVWLSWSGADGATLDVYRNGVLREQTRNDGKYIRSPSRLGRRTYTYRVCETGTTRCSNAVTAAAN